TYIRTLASDTGKALDIPATMTSLTRTMGSGFTLSQAHDLTEIEKLAPDDLLQIIVPIKDILTWPTHILSDDEWFAVKNGQKIAHWEPSTNFKQLYYNDKLKAVYQYDNSEQVWRSRYVFDNQ
ncbi:MAG: tRNA pseudouridine(55) synthase TruB, partial [Leuconostoc falkenbergense]